MESAAAVLPVEVPKQASGIGTSLPEFATLTAERLRFVTTLTVIYLVSYMGLSVLCGFYKDVLAIKIFGPINLGFFLIAFNYGLAWILAVIYTRWASRRSDPIIAQVQALAAGARQ